MELVNYKEENMIYVKEDETETLNIKENLPEKIAVLRCDTDWYESSKKELDVLYP